MLVSSRKRNEWKKRSNNHTKVSTGFNTNQILILKQIDRKKERDRKKRKKKNHGINGKR